MVRTVKEFPRFLIPWWYLRKHQTRFRPCNYSITHESALVHYLIAEIPTSSCSPKLCSLSSDKSLHRCTAVVHAKSVRILIVLAYDTPNVRCYYSCIFICRLCVFLLPAHMRCGMMVSPGALLQLHCCTTDVDVHAALREKGGNYTNTCYTLFVIWYYTISAGDNIYQVYDTIIIHIFCSNLMMYQGMHYAVGLMV